MGSALPTVYALGGKREKKRKEKKRNCSPNNTRKCRKITTHDITPFLRGFTPEHP
jgi:hypothetical protein